MKRKTSKKILAESFREVAESKNIDKITVKDITDNCGYSPATFTDSLVISMSLLPGIIHGRLTIS
ncbi:hypothetical protein [Butyrivibrio sp. VCD2006]|uniref:hypothetical protein n=1 Tax=Butyrivibrio sp. VCD2006 TaxID=1280664 RepID=UPI00047B75F6|nr:hypothetical protein [Butyrivibrio sp. VCD2006]